jgi:hypothetical protein
VIKAWDEVARDPKNEDFVAIFCVKHERIGAETLKKQGVDGLKV